jgi:general secretion pathway protein G
MSEMLENYMVDMISVHSPRLLRYSYLLLGDIEKAQSAVTHLIQNIQPFELNKPEPTRLLFRACRRHCLRINQSRPLKTPYRALNLEQKTLRNLSFREVELIRLRYCENLSLDDIEFIIDDPTQDVSYEIKNATYQLNLEYGSEDWIELLKKEARMELTEKGRQKLILHFGSSGFYLWLFLQRVKPITLLSATLMIGLFSYTLWSHVDTQVYQAKKHKVQLDFQLIAERLENYRQDCGKFPQGMEALKINKENCPYWGPQAYIRVIPKDPWQEPYQYQSRSNQFILSSYGQDGQRRGEGKNQDIYWVSRVYQPILMQPGSHFKKKFPFQAPLLKTSY